MRNLVKNSISNEEKSHFYFKASTSESENVNFRVLKRSITTTASDNTKTTDKQTVLTTNGGRITFCQPSTSLNSSFIQVNFD